MNFVEKQVFRQTVFKWRDDMGIGMSLDGDIWSNCLSRDEADHELACIFQGIRMGMEVSIK